MDEEQIKQLIREQLEAILKEQGIDDLEKKGEHGNVPGGGAGGEEDEEGEAEAEGDEGDDGDE